MPCNDYSVAEEIDMATKAIRDRCHAATRAACEMAKLIQRTPEAFYLLSFATRQWIRQHDEMDKRRKKEGK